MATTPSQQPGEQELEKLVKDFQILQEQLRASALQLDQLQNQKADLERAKGEIEKASGKVYITIGNVIVETTKEKALAEIKEKSELAEARVQSTTKHYNDLKAKEKASSERITQLYKQGGGA